jgi:hypothetical protein
LRAYIKQLPLFSGWKNNDNEKDQDNKLIKNNSLLHLIIYHAAITNSNFMTNLSTNSGKAQCAE